MTVGVTKGSFPSLSRCFRAWQRLAQRAAQYRRHLARQRVRLLRICLGQWTKMSQLQASDVAKVAQLAFYQRKTGEPWQIQGGPSLQPELQLVKLWSPVKLVNIIIRERAELGLGESGGLEGGLLGRVLRGSRPFLGCIPVPL